jgi:hypothetical protein
MSLKKAVFIALVFAGYAYIVFWTAFTIHAAIVER